MSASNLQIATFRQGSRTYYNASRFFPKNTRDQVIRFYAFVRVADDLVDSIPQKVREFDELCMNLDSARRGIASGFQIADDFALLEAELGLDIAWTDAFLCSMRMDLEKTAYRTIEETLAYIYGSAEVIGLTMAKILKLSPAASHAAKLQGRAMQMINFIRDIAEDGQLGRVYLPQAETSLPDLCEATCRAFPEEFIRYIRKQVDRYLAWQAEAQTGYVFIPRKYLIPIKTASDMYAWTALKIRNDPFIVFRRKVKPTKLQVFWAIAWNWLLVHPKNRSIRGFESKGSH